MSKNKTKCVQVYTDSQGKRPGQNSDFVASIVLACTRGIAVLGDFAGERPAVARSCQEALNEFFDKKKDEWIDINSSEASIVMETANFVNGWLARQTGNNMTTLVVALYNSRNKQFIYVNRGDSGIVIVGKEGESAVRFLAIGDVDESKMAASHITGKPKNFSPRSETLNDGDVVFAFTDGLWANLKPLRPENKLFFSELTKGPLTQIEARAKANILEKSSSDDDLALFVLKEEEVERPDTSAQPQATRNDGQKRLEVLADEIEMLKRNLDALDSSNVSVNEELLVNVKAIPKISANLNESLNILREEITERDHSDVLESFAKRIESIARYVSEEFKDLRFVLMDLKRKIDGMPSGAQGVSADMPTQPPKPGPQPTEPCRKTLREEIEECLESFLQNCPHPQSPFIICLKKNKKVIQFRIEYFYFMVQKYCFDKTIEQKSVKENDKILYWYDDTIVNKKIKDLDLAIQSNKNSTQKRFGNYLDDCIASGDPVDVSVVVEKWLQVFHNIWFQKKASSSNSFVVAFSRFFSKLTGAWKDSSKLAKFAVVLLILLLAGFVAARYWISPIDRSKFEFGSTKPAVTDRDLTRENIPNLGKEHISSLTVTQIASLNDGQVREFTAEQIAWLDERQLRFFGAKTGLWREEKVRALGERIASANLSRFTVEHIRWLTSAQINRLTMTQIQQCFISTHNNEAVRRTRIQAILSADQGATPVSGDGFGNVSPDFLNTLATGMKDLSQVQIQGLSPTAQIPHLNKFFITWLTREQISWLSADQLNALSQDQIEHGGTVLLANTTQLRDVGGQFIGGLTRRQIESLNETMIAQIGTNITALQQKFEYIMPGFVPSLTTEQLGAIGQENSTSFTDDQIAELTDGQIWALGVRRPVSTKLIHFLSKYFGKTHTEFLGEIMCMKNWIDEAIRNGANPQVFYPEGNCQINRGNESSTDQISVGWKSWFENSPVPYDKLFVIWLQIKIGMKSASLDGDLGPTTKTDFTEFLSEVMNLGQETITSAVAELDQLKTKKYR